MEIDEIKKLVDKVDGWLSDKEGELLCPRKEAKEKNTADCATWRRSKKAAPQQTATHQGAKKFFTTWHRSKKFIDAKK